MTTAGWIFLIGNLLVVWSYENGAGDWSGTIIMALTLIVIFYLAIYREHERTET